MLASSGGRAGTGCNLVRQGIRAQSKLALHHGDIDPSPELETNRRQYPDMGETQPLMQADRTERLATADHCNHLSIAELGTPRDHLFQQGSAETVTDFVGLDIDRILERETIPDPWPEQA